MRLLFLVNGSEQSAAASRAQAFLQRLPSTWQIETQYRPATKWKGILPFVQSATRFRPDLIYVMDTAYTGVLAAQIACHRLRCRMVTDTGDAAYALARSAGTYSRGGLLLIRWVEHLATRRSDGVVVRGSYHQRLLESQGVQRCAFIPDGVDLRTVEPVNDTSLRDRLGLQDNLVVGLVGTMHWSEKYGICYGWDVIEAIGLLPGRPVKALLVGDGDGRPRLEARAAALGIADRVVFAGTVPYDHIPKYLACIDVCVSTQSNDVVGQVRTTGKLPLYLACGKYVAATAVGEANRVLPGIGSLLPYEGVCDPQHPARLAAHLETILMDPKRLEVAPQARQVAQREFDYDLLTKRLERFCRTIVVGCSPRDERV